MSASDEESVGTGISERADGGCCSWLYESSQEKAYALERCGNSSTASALVAVCRYWEEASVVEELEWFDSIELWVAMTLNAIGYFVQATLAFAFWHYWVEVKSDPYEPQYYAVMAHAVDNATVLNMSMSGAGTPAAAQAIMNCQINHAPPILHYVALFIWFGVALNKICNTIFQLYIIYQMPTENKAVSKKVVQKNKCIDPPPGERKVKLVIENLPQTGKWIAYGLVLIPELLLNFFVAFVGAEYISVVTETNLLVKASLKMNFIARLDKLIQPSYVSYNWEDYVRNSLWKVDDPVTETRFFPGSKFTFTINWDGCVRTIAKVAVGMFVSVTFIQVKYYQVEDFRKKCDSYYQQFPGENVLPGMRVGTFQLFQDWYGPDCTTDYCSWWPSL